MLTGRGAITAISVVAIIAAITMGMISIGSPAHQRAVRMDGARASDLRELGQHAARKYRQNGVLPETLEEVRHRSYRGDIYRDPKTNVAYDYEIITVRSYRFCAIFETEGPHWYRTISDMRDGNVVLLASNAEAEVSGSGRQCFEYIIPE